MLLLEAGEYRIVLANDDDDEAVQFFVDYFELSPVSHQSEDSGDWVLEDGTVVSVCYSEDYLIV